MTEQQISQYIHAQKPLVRVRRCYKDTRVVVMTYDNLIMMT